MPERIESVRQLARACDKSHTAVNRWVKDERWEFGPPPWSRSKLPKILRWIAETLKNNTEPATTDDELRALRKQKLTNEIRKLLAQAERVETELSRERGKLLDAAEVEQEWSRLGVTVRQGVMDLPQRFLVLALNHGMPHEAAAVFERQMDEMIRAVLNAIADKAEAHA